MQQEGANHWSLGFEASVVAQQTLASPPEVSSSASWGVSLEVVSSAYSLSPPFLGCSPPAWPLALCPLTPDNALLA